MVRVDRARGLLLGLLLGDAVREAEPRDGAWLLPSPASQLACFTVEGMIRAHVRGAQKGICSPPHMVWFAYQRWAYGQGLIPKRTAVLQNRPWPDGWLHQQLPLTLRRGDAPATVAALQADRMGTRQNPVSVSAGHHALSNALPVALFWPNTDIERLAQEVAAITHGAPAAQGAAGVGALLLAAALRAGTVAEAATMYTPPPSGPAGTAGHALAHGLQVARAHPNAPDFVAALRQARAVGGRSAATFTGAFLGAVHGVVALPQDLLGRLELGMIADQLARDAVLELEQVPVGGELSFNQDEWWWHRYPGY